MLLDKLPKFCFKVSLDISCGCIFVINNNSDPDVTLSNVILNIQLLGNLLPSCCVILINTLLSIT
jgi:hypothetical protein